MQLTVGQARRVHGAIRSPAGFSLIELMITLVVMSVAMAMAVPGFRYLNNSSRITAPANELVAGLQLARAEAVRRNARVVLCGSSDGASCAGGSNWGGWIVFADTDSDNTVDAGEDVLMTYAVQAPATLQSSAAMTAGTLVFRSDGFARDTAGALLQATVRACVATTVPSDNVRDVTIGTGTRVFIARESGNGACGAPTNS